MHSISIKDLHYSVGSWDIVRGFSYDFPLTGVYGILAPVEEQISYLLKIIDGIIEPDSGSVFIGNQNIHRSDDNESREIRKRMSYVFDRGGILANLSILENILLPLDFHFPEKSRDLKIQIIKDLFERFNIPEKILMERPAGLHPQMSKMVLLIRGFCIQPSIILYDNPLSDLELRYKKLVLRYIMELQQTPGVTQIFVSTSDSLFEIANNNLVFSKGICIEEGSWEELIVNGGDQTRQIIKEYLEVGINET